MDAVITGFVESATIAVMAALAMTSVTKLVENHEGRAFVKFLPSQPALQQVFALIP